MNIINTFDVVDAHCDCAPFRFVFGGVPALHGETMTERLQYLQANYDWVRKRMVGEPGGKRALLGAVITDPISPEADFGVFFYDAHFYQPMCGGGSLCLAYTVAAMGLIPLTEPETRIVFETPAGMVTTYVTVKDTVIKKVTLENIPSFLYKKDVTVNVEGIGDVTLDIGFGGNFFCLVDVEPMGLTITPDTCPDLGEKAVKIIAAVNKAVKVQHPANPAIDTLDQVLWCQTAPNKADPQPAQCVYQCVNNDYRLDDCPCGTGTSARMARMFARGKLGIGEQFIQQNCKSPTKKQFYGEIVGETEIGGVKAIIPRISSTNCSVLGFGKMVITTDDQYREGFEG